MKLSIWAIALAAAAMTPAAAAAPQVTTTATASPQISAPGAAVAGDVATPAASAAIAAPAFPQTAATPGVGMPGGRLGLQDQFTDLGQRAADFHNGPLLLMCLVISLFVLVLLGYTMFKYRRGANPEPSRNTHHTMLEVVWTLVPVLILVAIAIPSIRLLAAQYSPPPADLTIKVIGHQWNWSYEYPDNGGFSFDSYMLKEQGDPSLKPGERYRTDADGPPLLAADARLVIPAGKVVKFIITSEDVIHSFAVPAFWTKMDAVPGRLNQEWVKVDRPGVYFGQCSELCGARHGFMPIAVEVLPEAQFNAWLASKGGSPKGAKPAAAPAAPAPADPAAIEQPALTQPVTAQN